MTESEAHKKYKELKPSEMLKLILKRDEDSELAAFYLLRYTMIYQLREIYSAIETKIEFCDVLSDFYLFLRDGRNEDSAQSFQSLESIHWYQSAKSWILTTFKNFLYEKINIEKKELESRENVQYEVYGQYDKEIDLRIHHLSLAISYMDMNTTARERYIYLRSLMEHLNPRNMASRDEIAEAMNISYANYRQIESRMRKQTRQVIDILEQKQPFELDEPHLLLAKTLEDSFDNLRPIIQERYYIALDKLDCKDAIMEVLQRPTEDSGIRFRVCDDTTIIYETPLRIEFDYLSEKRQVWKSFVDFMDECI